MWLAFAVVAFIYCRHCVHQGFWLSVKKNERLFAMALVTAGQMMIPERIFRSEFSVVGTSSLSDPKVEKASGYIHPVFYESNPVFFFNDIYIF